MTGEQVVGLLLAAGSGSRLGMPKALVEGPDGVSWLARALEALSGGGCGPTYVVLGAEAGSVRSAVPAHVPVVVADDWAEGMGASLRAGLTAVRAVEASASAVVVMLVDTPGVTADVVRRLIAEGSGSTALARATYGGAVGHPVLIGRSHWPGVLESAGGDRGARDYLAEHEVSLVESGDLGSGDDIDTPEALSAWERRGEPPAG